MTDAGLQVVLKLNQIANTCGQVLLAPLHLLSELTGMVFVSVVSGLLLLIAFKYTSNQSAIKRVRDGIKADMLALSLFKDSMFVSLRSQFRIVLGAFKLIALSLVPILCMVVPVTLLLGQLSLWWQHRPLLRGEEAVVTLRLKPLTSSVDSRPAWPSVEFNPAPAAAVTVGPVRISSQREICWNVRASADGYHLLQFLVDGQTFAKEIAIGERVMRVSQQRPEQTWMAMLTHPAEAAFDASSPVQSIEIQYPTRTSRGTGGQLWPVYWFIASSIVAYSLRGVFRVQM
ncbi:MULTISPECIES: hypothetical protein [unclassified Schlesneria]|uniref:hypothetical protein n=1 Tax=unclassified Schlesneria TaxID=2762017 RepID=UPI002F05EFD0